MTANSNGAPKSAPAPVSWPSHGSRRGQAPLRLLGALRGSGVMVWPGGELAVGYELDVFGAGVARSASGALEGDFPAALMPADDDSAAAPVVARLRLEDGREVAIAIMSFEPPMAQFEVHQVDAGHLWPDGG